MHESRCEEFKPNQNLTSQIRKLAIKEGADLFGVASVESLAVAPKGFRPQDILPGCRVVIIVGKRLSDATVDTTPSRLFDIMYSATNVFLDLLVLKITDALIRHKSKAIAMGPHAWNGKLLIGDLSFKHAAVAAGLGRFGLQSLVLTPHFGPRQRWSAVITDAPLEFTSPLAERLCKPEECGYACVKGCPAKAFSKRQADGITDISFPRDGLWYYWNIDKRRCLAHRDPKRQELGLTTHEGHACAICMRVCPVGHRD